jgi:ATP-dependent RNA helicase SUPV3L1/SUV3
MALRAQIWALIRDIPVPTLPPPGLIALPDAPVPDGEVPPPHMLWPSGFAEAMGWLPAGPVLLRLDVAERIAAELGFLTRRAPAPPPPDLASRLGVKGDMLGTALTALGFRILDPVPLEEGQHGPPTPLRVAPAPAVPGPAARRPRRRAPRRHRQGARPDRNRRPPQPGEAQPPREGGARAEFYGPPVPPELRVAMRPPRPERDGHQRQQQQQRPTQRDNHRAGGEGRQAVAGRRRRRRARRRAPRRRGGAARPPVVGARRPAAQAAREADQPGLAFAILANLKLR